MKNGGLNFFEQIGLDHIKKSELEEIRDRLKLYKLVSNNFSILMDNNIIMDDIRNDEKIIYIDNLHINEDIFLKSIEENTPINYLSIAFVPDSSSNINDIITNFTATKYRPRVFSNQMSTEVDSDDKLNIGSLKYFLIPDVDVSVNRNIYEIKNIIEVNELLYLLCRYERGSLSKQITDIYLKEQLIKKKYL